MPTVMLPLEPLIVGFAAVLPHSSPDDVTPVITTVALEVKDEEATLTATDRYTIGRYTFDAVGIEDVGPILVPKAGAKFVSMLTSRKLRQGWALGNYRVRITSHDGLTGDGDHTYIEVLHDNTVEVAQTFDYVAGNYPPVGRLIDGWAVAEEVRPTTLNGDHLFKFLASQKALGRSERIRIEFSALVQDSKKPGPMKFTIGDYFVGLLQPDLTTV